MDDVREVGAELHRLAEADELDPFDPATMIQRGRRAQRRRKILAGGAAVTGVAVVAIVATVLPNLGAAGTHPEVAAQQPQNPLFEPVPGAPYGEAGADRTLTIAEANRRCALRYPDEKRPLNGTGGKGTAKTGQSLPYEFTKGKSTSVPMIGPIVCKVPGGDKPSAALIAAVKKDPLPTTEAGKLRSCSVQFWVDLTNWRVVASDQSKRMGTTSFVAISPSGRKAVACSLELPEQTDEMSEANSQFMTLDALGPNDPVLTPGKGSQHADLYAAAGGSGGLCVGTPCPDNYSFSGYGRVASNATMVRLQLGPGPVHEVPVKDGWFAFTWLSPTTKGDISPHLTAYDKEGKVVKVIAR